MAGSPFGFRMMYQFAALNKKAVTWQDFRRHVTPHGMASTAKIFKHSLADLPGNYRSIEEFSAQIKLPVMILWGDNDPFVSEERAAEIADDLATFFDRYEKGKQA